MSEAPAVPLPRGPALGEPGPWFKARSNVNPRFAFDTVGGRYVAMVSLPRGDAQAAQAVLEAVRARPRIFDDVHTAFFAAVTADEDGAAFDAAGLRVFYDDDRAIATAYGALRADGSVEPTWWVLDPQLRLVVRAPLSQTEGVMRFLEQAPPPELHAGTPAWAPVLLLPRVFEPEFCRVLIDYYERTGGEPSGFMREVNGKTTLLHDPSHKRREDVTIEDQALCRAARERILRRLVPEIHKAFQFKVTRMERYIVACYSAEDQGFFRRHRDNTTAGTAHRRFAVTLNLNAEEYDGGELRFPEFGPRTYKPPTGGAVVFSCSMLHEATPVTRGKRYAFLPFLYDEAGAEIRERNIGLLAEKASYRK